MEFKSSMKEKRPVEEDEKDVCILQRESYLTTIGISGERRNWRVQLSQNKSRIRFLENIEVVDSPILIEVVDIKEVRLGCQTDELHSARQGLNQNDKDAIKTFEDRCFSLHVGEGGKMIYSLLAQHPDAAHRWIRVIRQLLSEQSPESVNHNFPDPRYWLRRVFREGDVHRKGYLSFEQCIKLLRSKLNVPMDKTLIEALYHASSTKYERCVVQIGLDEDEFIRFYQLASYRPELDQLFYDLIGNDLIKTLSAEKLLEFLTQEQKVANLDLDKILEMITKYDPTFEEIPLAMSLNGFRAMMVSEVFDIRKEEHRKINQPMDRPISHYWIKSSHNTYLTSDQLVGKSSIEGYTQAIADNCACLELDLWDGPNGEPIVYHGHTLVSKILARDVLRDGILPFAFIKDDYPIILSIEDHLSDDQRKVFIRDFYHIMGEHVYVVNVKDLISLPSPNQLKRKIIIKASNEKWGELVNICQKVRFPRNALKKDAKEEPVYHMFSLSENKINKKLYPTLTERIVGDEESAQQRRQKMRELTARQQIRVYPGAQRQLSDNYNPIDALNAGCQMVAMNIQTKGSNMAIYDGRFRANGDCGYVLKPDFLIDPSAPRVRPKRVKIKIISAQNLPLRNEETGSVSSPCISVRIDGEECDKARKTTNKVIENGLNPVWNTEFVFDVQVPELAIILFQAKDNDRFLNGNKSILGSFALPVLSLEPGYRHISLSVQDRCFFGDSFSDSLLNFFFDTWEENSSTNHEPRFPVASVFVKVTVDDI